MKVILPDRPFPRMGSVRHLVEVTEVSGAIYRTTTFGDGQTEVTWPRPVAAVRWLATLTGTSWDGQETQAGFNLLDTGNRGNRE